MIDYSALAQKQCEECQGGGQVGGELNPAVCNCVYRHMFRDCLSRYHSCVGRQASLGTKVIEEIKGVLCSRPAEDYIADFETVCRRALANHRNGLILFNKALTRIDQIDANWASRLTKIPLHQVQALNREIGAILGRRLYELRPYPLYPLKHYFGMPITRKRGTWKKL